MLSDVNDRNGYLNKTFSCSCGRVHKTSLKSINLEKGAARTLAAQIISDGYRCPLIVADRNTWPAAGGFIEPELKKAGITYRLHILPGEEIHPDEYFTGSVLMACDPKTDLLVAAGSGSINDICRFVSFRMGLPYYIFGTAPSMDGFASNVAAMTTNQMKITYPAQTPERIFLDPDILADAPAVLIQAGFGDILGKFTCLAEWKISSLVTDEYYCPEIAGLTAKARDQSVSLCEGLARRDHESLIRLTDALILSGIAMSYAGTSRPASGSEHHLSHFWEMRWLAEEKNALLHGIKVGIGTVVSLKLYELLKDLSPDFAQIRRRTLPAADGAWEAEIRRAFGPAADDVIALEHRTQKNGRERRLRRIERLEARWSEIMTVIRSLPDVLTAEQYLRTVGNPVRPAQVGLDRQIVLDSILYAKEVRDRYTILQLLWDLGLLEEFARTTTDFLFESEIGTK